MSKVRGYLITDEMRIVYVEDPKREYIEAGDEILVRLPNGRVTVEKAACQIQTSYSDEVTDRMLIAALEIAEKDSVDHLPRLIGTVSRDYWYGEQEEKDAE